MDINNEIKFKDQDLYFTQDEKLEKGVFDTDLPEAVAEPEVQGVKIRLGNAPIVHNLKRLMELSNHKLPPEIEIQFENRDIYTITHAIGVARIKGHTKIRELQYNAEVIGLEGAQTIDLLPSTKFETAFRVNAGLEGAIKAGGSFTASIPEELKKALSGKCMSLGGDLELELSTNSQFVGKINYCIKLPVVQSIGISSNKCTWILNPDENPLLGDQLMVQTLAVPSGTSELTYHIKGLIKVKKGLFDIETKETLIQKIVLKLN